MTSVQAHMKGPFDKETYWKLKQKRKLQQEIRAQQKVVYTPPTNLTPIPNRVRDLNEPKGSATAVHFTKGYRTAKGTPLSKRIREGDKKRAFKLKHPESKRYGTA